MSKLAIKKTIIVVVGLLLVVTISLSAYWMSKINAPEDDKEGKTTIIIGVGEEVDTVLEITKELDLIGKKFVPLGRENDSVDFDGTENPNISSYVFTINAEWQYEHLVDPEKERGVLILIPKHFIFLDENNGELEDFLTELQLDSIISMFTFEFGYYEGSVFIPYEDDILLVPNTVTELKIRVTFKEDPQDLEIRSALLNAKFKIPISLKVTDTILLP